MREETSNTQAGHVLSTKDLNLASALLAVGIPLIQACNITKEDGGSQYLFLFQDKNADGDMVTGDLVKGWYEPDYVANHPNCPFSYVKCAYENRNKMLDEIKQGIGYQQFKANGKIALVPNNMTAEGAAKLFGKGGL